MQDGKTAGTVDHQAFCAVVDAAIEEQFDEGLSSNLWQKILSEIFIL